MEDGELTAILEEASRASPPPAAAVRGRSREDVMGRSREEVIGRSREGGSRGGAGRG